MLILCYNKTMIIYKITNLINNKVYIGQTIQKFKNRIIEHKKRMKNGTNTPLYNSLRKYGIENFKFEIIEEVLSKEELNQKEIYYIEKFNSLFPNGYNLTSGGAGTFNYQHTEIDKQKMSKLKKGLFNGKKKSFLWETSFARTN